MSDLRASLETIPGLVMEVGLGTVGGRVESLARLLARYATLHAADGERLRGALEGGRMADGHALAHGVKGAAGFLGLVTLQALAAQLEAGFKAPEVAPRLAALLDEFEAGNTATCAAITALDLG